MLLLPFLLVAARPTRRRLQVIYGCILAGVPLLIMSLLLFGLSIPNLSQQGSLLTPFSFPNLFGDFLGVGGSTSGILRLADCAGRGRPAAAPRAGRLAHGRAGRHSR